jgi:hypothetical protein
MSDEKLCPTCGAKSKDENQYCSDGFHAPGKTYWPVNTHSNTREPDNG